MKHKAISIFALTLVASVSLAQWADDQSHYVGKNNGKLYSISDNKVSWWQAQWEASQKEVLWEGKWWTGALASPWNEAESKWIWKQLKGSSAWVGGYWDTSKKAWNWNARKGWTDTKWNWKSSKWNSQWDWNADTQWFLATAPSGDQWSWWRGDETFPYLIEWTPRK